VGKLVFWIVVILVVLVGARILGRQAAARQARAQGRHPAAAPRPAGRSTAAAESMVRCAHCGIHLPRSEALMLGGDTWCSQEHARLGRPG